MSKLFKLKAWLTLDEAATHLSSAFGELVEKKDIFRLALDGYLKLSVNLVNRAQARSGRVGGPSDAVYFDSQSGFTPALLKRMMMDGIRSEANLESIEVLKSLKISDEIFLNFDEEIESVGGVWDLSMWGGEKLDVEHEYQILTDGPAITLETFEGVILLQGDIVCQLQESYDENNFQEGSKVNGKSLEIKIVEESIPQNEAKELREIYRKSRKEYLERRSENPKENDYYPKGGMPNDAVYIVKTEEVLRFLSSLDETLHEEKPLSTRERNTLLVLIATLCKEAKVDYEARGIASVIEKMTEIYGARISDDKIREILALLPQAVETRSK
jgi:hypothetical protein